MTTEQVLFALLRSEICEETVDNEIMQSLSPEMLEEVYALSCRHGLAHIAGQALSKLGVLGQDEISGKFQQSTMEAVTRYIRMSNAYHSICDAFEKAQIPFLPLKGSIIRDWYPEAWMRTSSDIDILVKKQDVETAAQILEESMGYCRESNGTHDVSFRSPGGIYLELHFTLIEETVSAKQEAIFSRVWEVACPSMGHAYMHEMPMSWFRAYHLSHMAKHVTKGDCPVKLFIDLLVMDRSQKEHDPAEEERLLDKCGLTTFYRASMSMVNHWFLQEPADELCRMFSKIILDGHRLKYTVRQTRKGGRLRYVMYRVFKPYASMKVMYPILEKHKWLYPFCQVHRWIHILFDRRLREFSAWELREQADTSPQEIQFVTDLLAKLEI